MNEIQTTIKVGTTEYTINREQVEQGIVFLEGPKSAFVVHSLPEVIGKPQTAWSVFGRYDMKRRGNEVRFVVREDYTVELAG